MDAGANAVRPAGAQRREPGRLRRRRRRPAGLRPGARLGAGIEGGPLVSLAVATNVLAALTGSASGGLTIALDALGPTYMQPRRRARHRPGAAASRRRDRRRHARQPAAQRRRGDPARGLRLDPPRRAISTSSWSASSAPFWRSSRSSRSAACSDRFSAGSDPNRMGCPTSARPCERPGPSDFTRPSDPRMTPWRE